MNNERPENDRDITVEDLQHTHRFKKLLTDWFVNDALDELRVEGELRWMVTKLVTHALGNNVTVNVAAVHYGLHFEDPTHMSMIEAADWILYKVSEDL